MHGSETGDDRSPRDSEGLGEIPGHSFVSLGVSNSFAGVVTNIFAGDPVLTSSAAIIAFCGDGFTFGVAIGG